MHRQTTAAQPIQPKRRPLSSVAGRPAPCTRRRFGESGAATRACGQAPPAVGRRFLRICSIIRGNRRRGILPRGFKAAGSRFYFFSRTLLRRYVSSSFWLLIVQRLNGRIAPNGRNGKEWGKGGSSGSRDLPLFWGEEERPDRWPRGRTKTASPEHPGIGRSIRRSGPSTSSPLL